MSPQTSVCLKWGRLIILAGISEARGDTVRPICPADTVMEAFSRSCLTRASPAPPLQQATARSPHGGQTFWADVPPRLIYRRCRRGARGMVSTGRTVSPVPGPRVGDQPLLPLPDWQRATATPMWRVPLVARIRRSRVHQPPGGPCQPPPACASALAPRSAGLGSNAPLRESVLCWWRCEARGTAHLRPAARRLSARPGPDFF